MSELAAKLTRDEAIAVVERITRGDYADDAERGREGFDDWKLSPDERALVASGRLAVLSLYASCERDYG